MKPKRTRVQKDPEHDPGRPFRKIESALTSRLSSLGKVGRDPTKAVSGRLSNTGAGGRAGPTKPVIHKPIVPVLPLVSSSPIPVKPVGAAAPITPAMLNTPHVKRVVEFIISKHGQQLTEQDLLAIEDRELLERVASTMLEYAPLLSHKLDKAWLNDLRMRLEAKPGRPAQVVEEIIAMVESMREARGRITAI